jgi:hypothetical protein
MDKPWKVISAFVGVFVAGAVFGGFFTLRATNKRAAAELANASQPAPAVVVETKQPSVPTPSTPAAGDAAKGAAQASTQSAARPQDRIVPALMRKMTLALNPTPEQRKKILPLIARATEDMQRLDREHWQNTTRVTERMYEDIAALLTPEQQIQLEKMRQEVLERVRKLREKQREEAQAKSNAARPANTPGQGSQMRKPATPEGANPR